MEILTILSALLLAGLSLQAIIYIGKGSFSYGVGRVLGTLIGVYIVICIIASLATIILSPYLLYQYIVS